MQVAVDISLYPLDADFIPPIKDVIDRLNSHDDLEVWTNAMSTQIIGDFDTVCLLYTSPGPRDIHHNLVCRLLL